MLWRKVMRKDTPEYVKEISRGLRKNQTEAEERLWQRLRGSRFEGFKFRRQYCLGRYIADFYCSKARLVIEIDGKIHEEAAINEYDKVRDKELFARGVKVLRFTNEQIMNEIKAVLDILHNELKI
jgi:very-short-patch-repair endonuclease